jgi:hypothetical protein
LRGLGTSRGVSDSKKVDRRNGAMPLSPEQEELCETLENGESAPAAAALIRQQANEIDDLWDRLSRAYALVREESPAEMIQEEMKQLQAMWADEASSKQPSHTNHGIEPQNRHDDSAGQNSHAARVRHSPGLRPLDH